MVQHIWTSTAGRHQVSVLLSKVVKLPAEYRRSRASSTAQLRPSASHSPMLGRPAVRTNAPDISTRSCGNTDHTVVSLEALAALVAGRRLPQVGHVAVVDAEYREQRLTVWHGDQRGFTRALYSSSP
jgi:hypothetical protein